MNGIILNQMSGMSGHSTFLVRFTAMENNRMKQIYESEPIEIGEL